MKQLIPVVALAFVAACSGRSGQAGNTGSSSALAGITFERLGGLPGGPAKSRASATNSDGNVVVGKVWTGSGPTQGFRWTVGGGMTPLPLTQPTATTCAATAVSSDGRYVVGDCYLGGVDERFRWSEDTGLLIIPGLNAVAISDDGSTAAGSSSVPARWTAAGGIKTLPNLPDPSSGNSIYVNYVGGMSADGTIIVGSMYNQAFRWTSASGTAALGTDAWAAGGVNSDGTFIVGGRSLSCSEAYLWTATAGFVGLGNPPGTACGGFASDVSDDGSVVVGAIKVGSTHRPTIWTAKTGMLDLEVEINRSGVDLAGDTLAFDGSSIAISGSGKVIVGSLKTMIGFEAFRAVLP